MQTSFEFLLQQSVSRPAPPPVSTGIYGSPKDLITTLEVSFL